MAIHAISMPLRQPPRARGAAGEDGARFHIDELL